MKIKPSENEFVTLRTEVLNWQDRKITFFQIAITLVTVYTGYMLGEEKNPKINLSWQIASIFPLLILSITIHINRIFELYQIRAATFLGVFHESLWENHVGDLSLSEGGFTIGYNKSMAIAYFFIAISSVFALITKFPTPFFQIESLIFGAFAIAFIMICGRLFRFNTKDNRNKMVDDWQKTKKKLESEDSPQISS